MLTAGLELELGRVRANMSFHDPELGSMPAGRERDVELTQGVKLLVKMKLLTLLHVYPDPDVDDVLADPEGPEDGEPAVAPPLQDPLDPEAELEAEAAAEQGARSIEVELTSTSRGTTQQR